MGARTLRIGGTAYPVLLPTVRDPRLHLAAVIVSLQVLGQVAFEFDLSIAQLLVALLASALLEVGIALRRQRVIMWPASALLTGNGVAFILRVPGTEHGDWWSLRGWWIFAGAAAVSLLSKHVIRVGGGHVFNPSNFGLVLCFLLLGERHAEPLDFWWAPMSPAMALALAIIVVGGFAILMRLHLLEIAVGFWLAFAAGLAVLAVSGHEMTARWHLGPIAGTYFWWVLVSSPEVLVFLFFMITDPKTIPSGRGARRAYAVGVGLLAALLIAPQRTEYGTKVALLVALALVCAARPLLERYARPVRVRGRTTAFAAPAGFVVLLLAAGIPARSGTEAASAAGGAALPPVTVVASHGVVGEVDTRRLARDLVAAFPRERIERVRVVVEPGDDQEAPVVRATFAGRTVELTYDDGRYAVAGRSDEVVTASEAVTGARLTDVAARVGLDFRHGAFRFGVTNDRPAMMGGGLCWLDYDNDGWLDLFVVNSYADDDIAQWQDRGGLPRSALFHNVRGRFVDVSTRSGAALPLRGSGCVAADLDADGFTDLYVTTAVSDVLLWNDGDGTFTEGARAAGVVSFGWHAGAAVGDVNGDGRVDLFVTGYADVHAPIPGSPAGFPTNHEGVRDLLFVNVGHRRFREVGVEAGLESTRLEHGLGAVFTDVNRDGRLDLYVANDEDPNRLYLNVAARGELGFRFAERGAGMHVADRNAGMGIASADFSGDGRPDLFVTNKRRQRHGAFRSDVVSFADERAAFAAALGTDFTGWGVSWPDLDLDGELDLVLANGSIPVRSLARDAEPVAVLTDGRLAAGPRTNGRGLAAADYDNDGRLDIAINSIGGRLVLLRNTGTTGHWLEVKLARFAPGALVTAVLPDGRQLVREVQAGSSYLSSEDPRVHFGLGRATRVHELRVRYPGGRITRLTGVAADRVLDVS